MSNPRIINETDKYDGSKEAKARLVFLFMVAHINIKCFVDSGKEYRKTVSTELNKKFVEFNEDSNKLTDYYNNEYIKMKSSIIFDLSVKLFNALTSFNALKKYITYDGKDKQLFKVQRQELARFNAVLNRKLQAKIVELNASININNFLNDCRNLLVHKGKIICHFDFLLDNDGNKNVPAFIIPVSNIWNNDYMNKINISSDYCLDSIEVFEIILSCFGELQKILDEIISK